MLKSFIVAYPWDLLDEGVDVVLDRLQGEVGVDGVSLWVATPAVTQLRIREVEPRYFRTRGGVFFQPSKKHYAATRIKPPVSSWMGDRDPLALVAEACADRGLALRVKLSAACTGRLAVDHPEAACKNVFGSVSHTSICLTNPEVQEYLCGLASDLSRNYEPAGMSVSDFTLAWMEALSSEVGAIGSSDWAPRALLFLCFCESCRQKAGASGVDVDAVVRSVSVVLQRYLDSARESDDTLGVVLADNDELAKFYIWRAKEMSAVLRRMSDAFDGELLLERRWDGALCGQDSGLDLQVPSAIITRIDEIDHVSPALRPDARRNELSVPASLAYEPHATQLVSMFSEAAELGFAGVEIDHYGLLPDAALTPVKQAVRFAKRSTAT